MLAARLKMAWERLHTRLRKATWYPVTHAPAGDSTDRLNRPESGPSARGGHVLDTPGRVTFGPPSTDTRLTWQELGRSFYQHGPGARARIRDETIEQHQARSVACEQLLSAMTPGWRRNPHNPADEIRRRGYAVFDGPAATTQPSTGSRESNRSE